MLDAESLVMSVETPDWGTSDVRGLAQAVLDNIGGPLGRFGHWIAPAVADELRTQAPAVVAGEVEVVLSALAVEEGVVGEREIAALEAVVADAEERCP